MRCKIELMTHVPKARLTDISSYLSSLVNTDIDHEVSSDVSLLSAPGQCANVVCESFLRYVSMPQRGTYFLMT